MDSKNLRDCSQHIYVVYMCCRYGLNAIMRDLLMEKRSGRIENFLRMSPEDFSTLLNLLSPVISKQDTRLRKAISAKERFIITLRFLSTGNSFEDLSYLARVSPHAISRIVMEVCTALISILSNQMQVSLHTRITTN